MARRRPVHGNRVAGHDGDLEHCREERGDGLRGGAIHGVGSRASVGSGGASSSVDPNTLIQLHMLRLLSNMEKQEAEESDDDDGSAGQEGAARGFAGIQELRREVKKTPMKVAKRYSEHVKWKLGIRRPSQQWGYRDYSRLLLGTFGKMKGFWRCRHLLPVVEPPAAAGRPGVRGGDGPDGAGAQGAPPGRLGRRRLGEGVTALLLLSDDDPLSKPAFGGEERELEAAYTRRRSLQELCSKQTSRWQGPERGEDVAAGDDEEHETDAKVEAQCEGQGRQERVNPAPSRGPSSRPSSAKPTAVFPSFQTLRTLRICLKRRRVC